jgi:hypothetical protein
MAKYMTSATTGTWGAWFGDFATSAAAKRYLTMNFTGPKVPDRESWTGAETRYTAEGRWQVRVCESATTNQNGETQ